MPRSNVKAPCSGLHLVLADLHIPHHDLRATSLALDFVKRHRPACIHLLGDILDAEQLSKYLTPVERGPFLQADIDRAAKFLRIVRKVVGDASIIYSEGNHENRLTRYARRHAQALAPLRGLTIPELLGFKELDIQWVPALTPYKVGHLWFAHGFLTRKHSAYTARAHLDQIGDNLIIGHTHRFGTHHSTTWSVDRAAWETGCLQRLDPEYIQGTPNWQQGWSVVTFHKGGLFNVEPVRILNVRDEPPCYVFRGELVKWHSRMPGATI